jgi:type I restriction enzyme S subunit
MEVNRGYKQTEVGVIPEDWKVKSLGDVFEFSGGYSASRDQLSDVGHCYLHYGDIHGATKTSVDTRADYLDIPKLNIPLRKVSSKSLLQDGDVVFVDASEDDEGASKHVVVVNPENTPFISGLHTIVAKSKTNELTCEYRHYCFLTKSIRQQFLYYAVGTKVTGISKSNIPKLFLPLPKPHEQRAIAAALSDVDALIAGLGQLIAKKRDLKQAAMQQLLTGQKRLPGFKGEWVTLNMAENSTLKARIGWQGLTTAEYLKTGEYYLVTGTDFANGSIVWTSCCFVAAERYAQDRNIQLRLKDILLTKDGTIGKVGFIDRLPGPTTLNSGVFVIRPVDDAYVPQFFYYILTSRIFGDFLTKLQAGSTISHLYQKDFVSFSFLVPATLAEQAAIAEVLSDIDAELVSLEQRRDKTRALKQGMMQELLTGRIRLL